MSTPTIPDQIVSQSPPPSPRNSWRLAALICGGVLLVGGGVGAGVVASSHPSTSVAVVQPVAAAPVTTTQAPIIVNQNNNAPAPAPIVTQTQTQTVPVYVPAAAPQSDAWSVAVAYTTDINSGDNYGAWSMLSSSVQEGWNGDYNTYVANFTPLAFEDVTYVSESGDAVTFTFYLHNVDSGWREPYTCTFTVGGGIITSSSSYQI